MTAQTPPPESHYSTVDWAAFIAPFREIFGIDLRTLALFRVGLGGVILASLYVRALDLTAHYTDFGVLPRSFLLEQSGAAAWSFHNLNGSFAFQAFLFCVAAIFAMSLMAGYRTRLATVVSWALLVSIDNRNWLVQSGEDQLLMVLCFWAMFLPTGMRFSVDAALDSSARKHPNAYFSVATMALLIQGASMYFFSALLKSDAQWIPDGTAVYYATHVDYFATPFGHWIRQFPDLLKGLTYYVWSVELIGPILIFLPVFHRPLRLLMISILVSMHVGFMLCLNIGLFSVVSILMNLIFIQGWMWDWLARVRGVGKHTDLIIYYDKDCGFCLKTCRLLRVFLVLPEAQIQAAQDTPSARELLEAHNSWVVQCGGDTPQLKWDAIRYLVKLSPFFGPLARLLSLGLVRRTGDRFYLWIAQNRNTLSRITGVALPFKPQTPSASMVSQLCAGGFLALVCLQNVSTLPAAGVRMAQPVANFRDVFGLYQDWAMFAPHPVLTSPWPVIVGKTQDGTIVDVYHGRTGKPDWTKPRYVSREYRNARWQKYLTTLEDRTYDYVDDPYMNHYARWLCRDWNRRVDKRERELVTFEIHFQVEWTQPDYRPKKLVKRHVWSHECFG